MDSNAPFQSGSSAFPAPQSNNPFLHSNQGSVTAPTTGGSLYGASSNTQSASSASGLNSSTGSSAFDNDNLSSTTGTSSTAAVDSSAANDLGANAAALGNSVMANLQSAASSIANHPTVQSINNGPVAQNVRDQASITQHEFQNLVDARSRPPPSSATGQPLTYYHSTFYTLLTWQNPRATAIIFASTVAFIFMTRYLNILSYFFKFAYFTLGITASLEIAGKLLFDNGLASRMRPRKYYTVSKASLETSLDDIEQLVNFFVIEGQRVLFAENVYSTIAVFAAAVVSYLFIKVIPFWGLALMATCVLYLGPLIYIKNREAIDSTVDQMEHVISTQAHQLRDLTVMHANQASQTVKAYADEYSHVAQEYMGAAKKSVSGAVPATSSTTPEPIAKSQSVGSTDPYTKAESTLSAPKESLTSSNFSSTSSSLPNYSAASGTKPNYSSTSSSTPISDFRTSAPPSGTTLGSNEFRPLSSNDFPTVPKRDAELVADSIRPHDSEIQPLLNH